MINKKHIAHMAKHVFRHERGFRDQHVMHPDREWFVGLSLAVVIFVIGTMWSANTFLKNRNVSTVSNQIESGTETVYREPLVKEVLKTLSEREEQLQKLLGVTPAPPPAKEEVVDEQRADVVASSTEIIESSLNQGAEENILELGD